MTDNLINTNSYAATLNEFKCLKLLVRVNTIQYLRKVKAIKNQSLLMTGLTTLFLIGYVIAAYTLFFKGLEFVGKFPGFGNLLIERLLFLMFAILFILLFFSNLIISYTNLFKNRESLFLLYQPIHPNTIFQWKFIESTVLASWAFLFLIAPFLAAYGLNRGVSWQFYPGIIVMVALFIILPAVIGAWLAIAVARHIENRAFQLFTLAIAAAIIYACFKYFKPEALPQEESRVLAVIDRLLSKTSFVEEFYLPSYWLSSGIINLAEGAYVAAVLYAMVLFSYSLLFSTLSFTKAGRFFFDSASAVQGRSHILQNWRWYVNLKRHYKKFKPAPTLLERFFKLLWWVAPPIRSLLIKDIRLFLRDTTQWAQTLVLFGLLTVYIVNLRHFTHQLTNPFWIHLVSYLNLMACALNLTTLTTRFIFPQFSLEGKRLWIVGMAPVGLKRIIMAKYWLASICCLIVTAGLILLSCNILKMPVDKTIFFTIAITVMTFTLTGMAVGFGVLYPNFKEDNPSKIVSGFGGTFCLVLSFLYIFVSVVMLAVGSPWSRMGVTLPVVSFLCWFAFALMSVGFGIVPMRIGLQRLINLEI
ncbi:MAG: putative ABC transporter permease subunit [Verrucomicrobiia bacterium]